MDVIVPLVAYAPTAVLVQLGEGALDHPAMTPPSLAALDPLASDPRSDPSLSQCLAAEGVVIPLVRVNLVRPEAERARTAGLNDRDGVHHLREHLAVVSVGGGEHQGGRRALPIGAEVTLRSGRPLGVPPIYRRRPDRFSIPLFASGAGTLWEFTLHLDQSSFSAAASPSKKSACNSAHTPAFCQSRSRRQHVMPLPQPISFGSISQGIQLISTKSMPVSAAR
jgi:hypothetical protein